MTGVQTCALPISEGNRGKGCRESRGEWSGGAGGNGRNAEKKFPYPDFAPGVALVLVSLAIATEQIELNPRLRFRHDLGGLTRDKSWVERNQFNSRR